MQETVSFTVEGSDQSRVRFGSVAEAHAFARFLGKRGMGSTISVATETEDGIVSYPIARHVGAGEAMHGGDGGAAA